MKYDNRETRRELIRRIVELHFREENDYPFDEATAKEWERIRARAAEFLSDEQDADLKEEAMYELFLQICRQHPEPKEPEWSDVLFLSKVMGRTPKEVKESLEQNSGKKIVVPC
jgi:aminoglycoside phosphotransferase